MAYLILPDAPRFIGKVKFELLLNEAREVVLTEDFCFVDSNGVEWLAPRDSILDGSSIPRILWPFAGSPFVGLHRVGSIPHDVYCKTKSRSHKRVHQMYEDACVLNGVSKRKAKILHRGIRIGGPKWKM